MKKFISLALAVIFVACSFCACQSKPTADLTEENISKTIETAFTALQAVDEEALGTYVKASSLNFLLGYTKKYAQFDELGKAMFANLSYEIKEINVKKKTATVLVKNKDMRALAMDFTKSLVEEYSTVELLSKLSDEAWLDENLSQLTGEIDAAQIKSEAAEIEIKIEQKKDHLVLVFSQSAEDEISGGVLGAIMSIAM